MTVTPIHGINADEFTTSEIIKVYVGKDKKLFSILRQILCAHSPFFAKCIGNDNSRESLKGEIMLDKDKPKAFGIIVNWLYHKTVPQPTDTQLVIYINAYVIADKFMMTTCKNNILDAFRCYHVQHIMTVEILTKVPEATLEAHPLLKQYILDQYAWNLSGNAGDLMAGDKEYFAAGGKFVAAIVERLMKYKRPGHESLDPSNKSGCAYHQHAKNEACTLSIGLHTSGDAW